MAGFPRPFSAAKVDHVISCETTGSHCVTAESGSVIRAQNFFSVHWGETGFASDWYPIYPSANFRPFLLFATPLKEAFGATACYSAILDWLSGSPAEAEQAPDS